MKKKILSIVLAIMMVLSVMPFAAFSAFAEAAVKPVANAENATLAGCDYAIKYVIDTPASANYDDYAADIIITADKDVAAGAVTFKGHYGEFDKELEAPAMTANTEYSLLEALGEKVITYWDLANVVKEFTCGIANNALKEDTTFTIKVVLSNGTDKFDVEGSDVKKEFEAVDVKPVANAEDATLAGCDYAIKYVIDTPASANYDDYAADIIITADKDVAKGAVTFKGHYGEFDKELEAPAMTANTEYSLLEALGEKVITYWDLANVVKEFTCGIANNALKEDTTFTIKVVLSNGTDKFDVEGSDVKKEFEAVDVKPVANAEDATLAGCDYAIKYVIDTPASANYDDYAADIIITADKDVAKGAVTFKGHYGEFDKELEAPAMTANTEYSLLEALGEKVITYWDLANVVKEFTCGIANNALEEDTTFTIKVVLSNGTDKFDVEGSDVKKEFEAVDVKPVANAEDATLAGCDYAIKYVIDTPASANYDDYAADIIITADKDVAAGAVTFKGHYGEFDKELEAPAMTANTEYSLLEALGEKVITYWDLANVVKEFTCGIANNALKEDTTFTIKVVLSNGTDKFDVEGSDVEKEFEAVDVKPVANAEDATLAGCDYAIKYVIDTPASANYDDYAADIIITADKDVAAGAVTFKGHYGEFDKELEAPAMTANTEYSLLEALGEKVITYWDLANVVKEFTCGIANNSLEEDTTFTIKVVLSNGTDEFDVEGSNVEKELEAADDLAAYKAEKIEEVKDFGADDVIPAANKATQAYKDVIKYFEDAINDADSKAEVDELKAQALKALDDFVPETYSVTASGAKLVSKALNPAKSTKYEVATVTINEANGIKDGKWFVYWKDQDGKIVSTYSTYSFFVVEDRTLTPVYVSPDDYDAERAKAVKVTEIVRTDDNGNGTVTLYTEHSASAKAVGNSISQHGFIWTTDALQKDNLVLENQAAKKAIATKTQNSLTGLFRATVNAGAGSTLYAVPYIIDADGNPTYGEMITFSVAMPSLGTAPFSVKTFETQLVQAEEVIPTAEETAPAAEAETEAAAGSTFTAILTSIINAIFALIQTIISLF